MHRTTTDRIGRVVATLVVIASGAFGAIACDSEPKKDPESCKVEGKESGEKCKACCTSAEKSGHLYMKGDCKCL